MSKFLERIGRACAAHPWRTLAGWLALVVLVLGAAGAVGGRPVDNFRLNGSEVQRAHDVLQHAFPSESGSSAYLVLHDERSGLSGEHARRAVAALRARLGALAHVAGTSDPYSTGAMSRDRMIARMEVRYDRSTDDLGRTAYDHLVSAIEPTRRVMQVEVGGPLAAWEQETSSTEWIGLLVAIVVLTFVFGSLLAMLLPIGLALVLLVVGQGALTILAGIVDVPSSTPELVTMIGLGVALDYSLFVVSRHLDHLRAGDPPAVAAGRAAATAGVAVFFAGSTVIVAISALFVSGIVAVGVMGIGVALAVAITVVGALTLLPGLLGLLGTHLATSRLGVLRRSADHEYRRSRRWAEAVAGRPVLATVVATLLLLVLASPVLALRLGQTDAGTQPASTSQRRAFDLQATAFGPGSNGPLLIVARGAGASPARVDAVARAVAADPGVAWVSPPRFNEAGDVAVVQAFPTTSPHADATSDLVRRLRDRVLPGATDGPARALVSGQTAAQVDLAEQMSQRLPLLILVVIGLSVVLLIVGFRSIVVPLKAALLNLLSIGAGYGVMVAIFQWGWGKGLIGLSDTVPIVSWVPLLMFAILFGLSMDYEVFLISAIRAAYRRHGDNRAAVVDGLSSTARVISAAAVIMLSVFGAFVAAPDPTVKMVGLGLAVAIFVDATVVRMALVPASMVLLGRANWWLPRWLDRTLPRVDLEGEPAIDGPDDESVRVEPTGTPVAAPVA
jgi:RND superfamily putative drug exporter